jgi:hypothetical protein
MSCNSTRFTLAVHRLLDGWSGSDLALRNLWRRRGGGEGKGLRPGRASMAFLMTDLLQVVGGISPVEGIPPASTF